MLIIVNYLFVALIFHMQFFLDKHTWASLWLPFVFIQHTLRVRRMISIQSWYYLFLLCWQLYENRNPLSSGIPDKIVPAGQGVGKNQWSCVCVTERQKVSVTLFICQTVSLTEKYETHVAVRRIEVRMCHCTSKSQKHQQQLTSEFSVNSSKTLTNYW